MNNRIENLENELKQYFDNNDIDSSIKTCEKILFYEDMNTTANYYKGLILARNYDYRAAIPSLKIVSENSKEFLIKNQVNLLLGYLYYKINNLSMSVDYFERVLKEGFSSPQIYNALGVCYYDMGKVKKAIQFTKKSIDLNKNNYNALNTLGYILVDTGVHVEKGLKAIKKSLADDPTNPSRLDSLGWAYYKLGKYDNAQKYLREALGYAPNEKTIISHLKKVIKKL